VPPASPEVHAPAFRAKGDRDGVLLPVHGLAGGVGTTTFATNLAWELATVSKTDAPRVCLLDFSFPFGSVSTYFGLPRKGAVFDVLSGVADVDSDAFLQSMLTFNDKLTVFTAPPDMLPLEMVTGEDVTEGRSTPMPRQLYVIETTPQYFEAARHSLDARDGGVTKG
jgi:pilus assembly protein CpaE